MSIPQFNPNIPQRKDQIGISALQCLNNFGVLYNAFKTNHVPLDAMSAAGNHTILQMPQSSVDFQTDVAEISLYSKLGPGLGTISEVPSNTSQLYVRPQGNGTAYPYTVYQIYPIPDSPNPPTQFFSFLPGGVIVYFGSLRIPNGQQAFTLNLTPAVTRGFVTMNFTPISGVSFLPPYVTIPDADKNGIFRSLIIKPLLVVNAPYPFYYLILGNI